MHFNEMFQVTPGTDPIKKIEFSQMMADPKDNKPLPDGVFLQHIRIVFHDDTTMGLGRRFSRGAVTDGRANERLVAEIMNQFISGARNLIGEEIDRAELGKDRLTEFVK